MSSTKSFRNLSKNECLEVHEIMLKNTDRKWKSAELLASDNDFGGAITSHIISIEELVKAIIIYFDGNGFEFRKVDEMDKILRRSHSLRHLVGFSMFVMNILMEDLKALVMKIKERPKTFSELQFHEVGWNKLMERYVVKLLKNVKEEFLWFKMMELLRQSGSHVDFDEKLSSPTGFTSNDYNIVLMRLNTIRTIGKQILGIFGGDLTLIEAPMEEFRMNMLKNNWYDKIGKLLKMVRHKNPFQAIVNRLEPGN